MYDLYRVVWAKSGREVTADELAQIALHEPWAKGLIYCDMEGFAVEQDGTLLLLDECGSHRYPPAGLFRVEWPRKAQECPSAPGWVREPGGEDRA